jgi:hypothetical protein
MVATVAPARAGLRGRLSIAKRKGSQRVRRSRAAPHPPTALTITGASKPAALNPIATDSMTSTAVGVMPRPGGARA